MDASFEELWKHFKLSDEEKGVMKVDSQVVAASKQQAQFSILFKLQTSRDFNKEAFKATCRNLWRGSQGVTIKEVGQNLFMGIFGSEEQLEIILSKSPWTFEKKLILMKRFSGDIYPMSVTFQSSPFWIRVFNIPIKSMTKEVGDRIATEVGEPIAVDAPKSGLAWGPFLRIRVNIDITKPLMRGKMIQIIGLEAGVVHKKEQGRPQKDVRDEDDVDEVQSLAEESTEFTEPPCAAVANPVQPVAEQRRDLDVVSTNPISISPKDKAIVLPGPIIHSNSSLGIQDQVTKMSSSNVEAEGIDAIPDLNFKRRDKHNFCKELEPEVEAYPVKLIRESAEQQFEIWEDREMELSVDKSVENIDLEKSSLRTWKRIMRNKKIPNSENVSNPKLLSSKRFAVTRDPNSCTVLHPHQKKLAIEPTIDPFPLPITRGGSLPPLHSP
nr:hypothetical protein CFP56_46468 [Quercus suber]